MTAPAESGSQPEAAFGVDIGGSGIKGAVVDTRTGELRTQRVRIATPRPSTPHNVADVVVELVTKAGWAGLVGATFPAVIKSGVALSAANVDPSWIGTDVDAVFSKATGLDVTVLNDADAAGLAEVRFGAAKGVSGVVILLTFGTGIGSGLFIDGHLVPNSELGHLELDGHEAEARADARVQERQKMAYRQGPKRVRPYRPHGEMVLPPVLCVGGGGGVKDAPRWVPDLRMGTPVRPAQLL